MSDFLSSGPQFNGLSLEDLLRARDQFHAHLLHKANVVGTAIGRYLIRKDDPYPKPQRDQETPAVRKKPVRKAPRTLENSEVREYSWPGLLVFVSKWVEESQFGDSATYSASDFVPKTIYLEDGKSVPVCVVWAPVAEASVGAQTEYAPAPRISGGQPIFANVQGVDHQASIGCLVSDGHTLYALTSAHVAGPAGSVLTGRLNGESISIGKSAPSRLTKLPFEKVYERWPGKHILVNADVGLVELEDQRVWSASIFGIGQLGPLADLTVENLSLNLIDCPVRAYGAAGGDMRGRIAALFYRYRSTGGFEFVADFLVGSRGDEPLATRHGDSGAVWVLESELVEYKNSPIGIQWGGSVFDAHVGVFPFALVTNLTTVCRELDVEIVRSSSTQSFEYWGAVGHYTIGALACEQVSDDKLLALMKANQDRVSFKPADLNATSANEPVPPAFVELADVPDKVWKAPRPPATPYGRKGNENPNHYADMDFENEAGETLDSLTQSPADLKTATWVAWYQSVGWSLASERGLVPFRVWQIYKAMVGFVQEQKVDHFVAAAGILAHYVGDMAQPLHSSYLTDGDPFMNRDGTESETMLKLGKGWGGGVHSAYETHMLDDFAEKLLTDLQAALAGGSHGMHLVTGGQEAGYAVIELSRRARTAIPPRDLVNAYGKLVDAGKKSQASGKLLKDFGLATVGVLADGCKTLAMLWESAWTEGNGQAIADDQISACSMTELQAIYEDQAFLPSKALGGIGPFL